MFSAPVNSILAACALAFALAGCGGGGGGGPAPVAIEIGSPVGLGSSPINKIAFPVILSGPASGALTVNYTTADVNATGGAACGAGVDYVKVTNGVLTIASGQSSGTIEIEVCNPAAFVANAALKVTLVSASGNGRFAAGGVKEAYGLVSSPSKGKLNDTGVTQCGDWTSQGACPKSGFASQDAEKGRDASALTNADADGRKGFAFAKIGTNAGTAEVLSGGSAAWDCVQDNVTGLMWEAKTDANKAANLNFAAAQAHVATLNAANLCGHNDWRLPTPQELAGLVDSSVGWSASSTATIDQSFFPKQQKAFYWTATSDASIASQAWVVDFRYGLLATNAKTATDTGVRLVRGTSSPADFQTPVAETVTDASTGLTWRQCVDGLSGTGCASGSAASYDWQAALARVAALNQAGFAGYNDWRLPNRNELLSIVNYAAHNPAINASVFPGFPSSGGNALSCWTSTPYAPDGVAAKAWFVDFVSGDIAPSALTNTKQLLLVRGGK
jgi:hypothetical protein